MTGGLDAGGLDQQDLATGQRGLPIWSPGEFHGVAVRKIRDVIGDATDQSGCQKRIRDGLGMLQDRGVLTVEEVDLLQTIGAPPDPGGPDVLQRARRLHDQLTLGRETSPLALALASLAMHLEELNFQNQFGAAVAGAVVGVHLGDGFGQPIQEAITGAIVGSAVTAGLHPLISRSTA